MRKLNLGCGPYPIAGYINIDINSRQSKADLIRDLRRGLPYDDSSVEHIVASHFLEHLEFTEMLFVMEECWRVLKPAAFLTVTIPLMDFSSLDHKQFFSEEAFDIFGRDAAEYFNRRFSWSIDSKKKIRDQKGDNLTVALSAVK